METSVVSKTAQPSEPLRIRLLGDLELRDGNAVRALPPSRRTRALLGFLIAINSMQSRSSICDLLWEGSEDPRASLRWSLTKLRDVVDENNLYRLVADREHVGFTPLACQIDTMVVQALLAEDMANVSLAALEEAAGLLQREFLDGLELPDCYRFHHWCMAERERYGSLRRKVLAALVERLQQQPERALTHARAMVTADPLTEQPHAALIRLLAAVERYPEAERHYEWALELLQREVGIPRGGALDQAIREVRRGRRTPAAAGEADAVAAASQPAQVPSSKPPPKLFATEALIGRKAERTAIAEVIANANPARFLLFMGEQGIGKTRLLEYFAQSAERAGMQVIRGRCFEAETLRPYGLWLDALRGVSTEGIKAETLARAAPLFSEPTVDGGSRERLFDAALALVSALCSRQTLALVLDDLQWLDEGSAAMLHFVLRNVSAQTKFILGGAARPGELEDNRAANTLVQSLLREGGVQVMELVPFSEAEARQLVGNSLNDVSDAIQHSGGNPLYLIELARATQHGIPDGADNIEALIEDRLRMLEPSARELLVWAAAMRRELRVDVLSKVMDSPVAEVLSRFERIERHGLIVPVNQGDFDFAHDVVRQAVYRSLSQPRRRAIHRQIAHVLLTGSAADPGLHGEIVYHAALAGDDLAAARACLAAGEHSLRLFANAQAGDLAERGLAHVQALNAGSERTRLEVQLLRLRVTAMGPGAQRRLPALIARIETAIATAEAQAAHADAAAGWEILAFAQQQCGNIERVQEATVNAQRATRRADAATQCLQLANTGRCLIEIEADPVRGRALIDEAAELARELDLKVMEIEWGRGLIARAEGNLDHACEALSRGVQLARVLDKHWHEYDCMIWLATAEYERGHFSRVRELVGEIATTAMRMGQSEVPFARALDALAQLREGANGAVMAALAEHLQALRGLDDKTHLAYALNQTVALELDANQRELAREHAEEALSAAQAVRANTEIAVAMAQCAAAEPDPRRATEALLDVVLPKQPSARAQAALAAARQAISTTASTMGR